MSYTKALRKKLPSMSDADLTCHETYLATTLASEKNPCIKSSLRERLEMIKTEKKRRDLPF